MLTSPSQHNEMFYVVSSWKKKEIWPFAILSSSEKKRSSFKVTRASRGQVKCSWEKKESFQMCTSSSSFMKGFASIVKWSFKCCIIRFNVHILWKYVSWQVFLTSLDVWELLERNVSFKGVDVDYKPFLVFIESHYIFKSEFESLCIQSWLHTCLCGWMPASREVWSLRA